MALDDSLQGKRAETHLDAGRRTMLRSVLAATGAALAPAAFAQAQAPYPSGPIKFVTLAPPGGGLDTLARLIGPKLTETFDQPVVVESRPGGAGAIAATFVARSAPDGLTVLLTNTSVLSSTVLLPNPGYQLAELTPVSIMVLGPIAIGVRPELGVTTLKQLLALAKTRKLSFGSYGVGSVGNFVGELLNAATGYNMVHVPYKGEAPAITDLLGGQIDAVLTGIGTQGRQGNRITLLATTGSARFAAYPDVPTFTEAGYPEANLPGWNGMFAPAKTPPAVLARLAAEVVRVVRLPELASRMMGLGFDPVGMTPEESAKVIKGQLVSIQRIVSEGRVKMV